MTERPILMHDRSIRGLLDGQKTQTRRPVKDAPEKAQGFLMATDLDGDQRAFTVPSAPRGKDWRRYGEPIKCPYGDIGDVLWVREAYKVTMLGEGVVSVQYRAVDEGVRTVGVETLEEREQAARAFKKNGWTPNIHMPRWACRILLRITDIQVHRVQEIQPGDAVDEGVQQPTKDGWVDAFSELRNETYDHEEAFQWDANPAVWALRFEIDEVAGQ